MLEHLSFKLIPSESEFCSSLSVSLSNTLHCSIPSVLAYHLTLHFIVCVCVYSNSRNDVPRVAQRYGTIVAHTRRRTSVLVVFVLFCVHVYSFAGLIRRTPPPTFSDTAITDRHSDTTIFQLRAHWVRISWSIGSEKSSVFACRYKLDESICRFSGVWLI